MENFVLTVFIANVLVTVILGAAIYVLFRFSWISLNASSVIKCFFDDLREYIDIYERIFLEVIDQKKEIDPNDIPITLNFYNYVSNFDTWLKAWWTWDKTKFVNYDYRILLENHLAELKAKYQVDVDIKTRWQ